MTNTIPATLLPFVHYERRDLPVVAMRGKVLVEDVTVCFPGNAEWRPIYGPAPEGHDGLEFAQTFQEAEVVKKFTLYPSADPNNGTLLQFDSGWQRHEEGGSQEGLTIEQGWANDLQGDDTQAWEIESYSSSRDCDGPLERNQTWISFGGTEPDALSWYPERSNWEKVGGYQRDHYAEAAGY